jgi:hypothetical protein
MKLTKDELLEVILYLDAIEVWLRDSSEARHHEDMADGVKAVSTILDDLYDAIPADVVTEYGQWYTLGFLVFDSSPEVEAAYPLADRINARRRLGGRISQRKVIVLSEWEELTENV